MDFTRGHFGKMNPWPVEHFFWAYLSSLLYGFAVAHSGFDVAITQKWWQICSKKCSTGQRFIFPIWLFTKSILYRTPVICSCGLHFLQLNFLRPFHYFIFNGVLMKVLPFWIEKLKIMSLAYCYSWWTLNVKRS